MKSLVIFYSLEGNTRYIAEVIAETIEGDILELKTVKKYSARGFMKFLAGGKDVLFKKNPQLEAYDFNPDQYSLLVIGTPIWAGNYTPPLKTFFNQQTLKQRNIALFCCCSGSQGSAFKNIRSELPDNNYIGEICFFDPLKKDTEKQTDQARKWIVDIVKKVKDNA